MNIKTYIADTMQEALDQVREELGSDALILSTRRIQKGSKWFGLSRRWKIEVVAGIAHVKPNATSSTQRSQEEIIAPQIREKSPNFSALKRTRLALDKIGQEQNNRGINNQLSQQLIYAVDDIISASIDREETALSKGTIRNKFNEKVDKILAFSGGIDFDKTEQQIIALVGPTGVGKTTTVAKIAAVAAVMNDKKVGMISIDAYRIGAYDQLKTYAEIMELPVELALSAQGARSLIDAYEEQDIIIVDSVGRSPNHDIHMTELHGYMKQINPTEVHLTSSASVKFDDFMRIVDRYKTLGINRLIFTKLDETVSLNTLANGAYETKYPISYLGVRQTVPDHLEIADATHMSKFLLSDAELDLIVESLGE